MFSSGFQNGYTVHVGQLSWDSPHRSAGKKVLEWQFRARGRTDPIGVTVTVESAEAGLRFKASSTQLATPVVDSDINRLHQEVERLLLEQVSALSGIDWSDWLEVIVEGHQSSLNEDRCSGLGGEVRVAVRRLKRGVIKDTGRVVTINSNGVVVDFPKARSLADGVIQLDTGLKISGQAYYETDGEKERSYIPATDADLKALEEVIGMMGTLRQRLGELMSQAAVQERLSAVNAGRVLLLAQEAVEHL